MKINHTSPNPLTGSISVLLNQDTGGPIGGTNPPPQPAAPAAPADPFADLDLDLLPPEAVAAINKGREQLKVATHEAGLARQYQSKADQTAAALAKQDLVLQDLQSRLAPPPAAAAPLTPEQELVREMIAEGVPEHVAKPMAKAQSRVMVAMLESNTKQIHQAYAPIVGQQMNQVAAQALQAVSGNAYAQDPTVMQQIQSAAQQMVADGHPVTPEILDNLGKMFHYNVITGQGKPPVNPAAPVAPPVAQRPMSFWLPPSGGVLPAAPAAPVMLPEVAAAMASVHARWGSQFKLPKP